MEGAHEDLELVEETVVHTEEGGEAVECRPSIADEKNYRVILEANGEDLYLGFTDVEAAQFADRPEVGEASVDEDVPDRQVEIEEPERDSCPEMLDRQLYPAVELDGPVMVK